MSNLKHRIIWVGAGVVALVALLVFTGVLPLGGTGTTLQPNTGVAPVRAQTGYTANDLEAELIHLYKQADPSVVSVQVRQPVTSDMLGQLPQIPGFPFQNTPQTPGDQNGQQQYAYGQGSGFVYDTEGHIVTNYHVAGEADQITVVFSDGTSLDATLVGGDPDSDLAVVKVDPSAVDLKPLPLADSDSLQVGQMVIAIGNPFGLEGSMTSGIVSALGRMLSSQAETTDGNTFSIPDVIQTDAAINPGNSGGPLLDLAGDVVGVNAAIESSVSQNSGVGFAIPSNTVANIVPALIKNGHYYHPWLGISGGTLTAPLRDAMGLDSSQQGVLVATVTSDSPADKAGLQGSSRQVEINGQQALVGGDVIVSANGQPIHTFDDLLSFISNDTSVGQTVTFGVLRDGKTINVDVTLVARPTTSS
jgi:serine protease Do